MRTKTFALCVCALSIVLSAGAAAAAPLELLVNPSGDAWIVNPADTALNIDGYQISSATGLLDPDGWFSLTDRGEPDWVHLSGTELLISEAVVVGSPAYYTLGAGESLTLGAPVTPSTPLDDLAFIYTVPGVDTPLTGNVVPEPATLLLLSLAAPAILRRR